MEVDKIWDEIKDMGSWFSKEDVESFSKLELREKATILELGTGFGKSTKALRLLFPDSDITTCDPSYQGELQLLDDIRVNYISDCGFNLKWNKLIDLLFIDDNHEYKTVEKDIKKYKKFITKGGYIVCHDYYGTGVEKAVKELLPESKIIQTGEFSQSIWKNNDPYKEERDNTL